jgi:hypothetical protein
MMCFLRTMFEFFRNLDAWTMDRCNQISPSLIGNGFRVWGRISPPLIHDARHKHILPLERQVLGIPPHKCHIDVHRPTIV